MNKKAYTAPELTVLLMQSASGILLTVSGGTKADEGAEVLGRQTQQWDIWGTPQGDEEEEEEETQQQNFYGSGLFY